MCKAIGWSPRRRCLRVLPKTRVLLRESTRVFGVPQTPASGAALAMNALTLTIQRSGARHGWDRLDRRTGSAAIKRRGASAAARAGVAAATALDHARVGLRLG